MVKFTDENKEVKEFKDNYFSYGVHKVKIAFLEADQTDDGKEFIEVTVMDPEDEELTDTARVWFTTDKAINYSFNVLRGIYTHNAPEDKKAEAGATFDAVTDLKELEKIMQKVVGGECWFTKYQDPTRTYPAADGSIRKSVNKNVMGYEPKLREDLLPKEEGSDQITKDNVNGIFGGAEPFTEKDQIPKSW